MGPPYETHHLPHILNDRSSLPARLEKRLAVLCQIVMWGSAHTSGVWRPTSRTCARRPGRKACKGTILVRRQDIPAAIDWECAQCASAGTITGWEHTEYHLVEQPETEVDARLDHKISGEAHRLLCDLAYRWPELRDLAFGSRTDGAERNPRAQADQGIDSFLIRPLDTQRAQIGARLLTLISEETRPKRKRLLQDLVVATLESETPGAPPGMIEVKRGTGEELIGKIFGDLETISAEYIPSQPRPRPRSTAKGAKRAPRTYQIKVSLNDVRPPVWRRLRIPSNLPLPMLHEVIQIAMGWFDCHLHGFRVGQEYWAPHESGLSDNRDTASVPLDRLAPKKGSRVQYTYDFGDNWEHTIFVEEVIDAPCEEVRCLKGKRACPPEDCGGPWGYLSMLEAISDQAHERHAEIQDWINDDFDPNAFDVVATDAALRGLSQQWVKHTTP